VNCVRTLYVNNMTTAKRQAQKVFDMLSNADKEELYTMMVYDEFIWEDWFPDIPEIPGIYKALGRIAQQWEEDQSF